MGLQRPAADKECAARVLMSTLFSYVIVQVSTRVHTHNSRKQQAFLTASSIVFSPPA
jgi:hypothetical protein